MVSHPLVRLVTAVPSTRLLLIAALHQGWVGSLVLFGHVSAEFDAAFQRVDAGVCSLHIVLLAFVQAFLTDIGTDGCVLVIDFGLTGAESGALVGDVCGIATEADTSS